MTHKSVGHAVLICVLIAALVMPARADLNSDARNIVIGIVAVTAAIAVTVTLLIVHEGRKDRTITGCVASVPNGMTITDENNKRVYMLTGDTAGIKVGDRISVRGRKVKSANPDKTLMWETRRMVQDFGVCPAQ